MKRLTSKSPVTDMVWFIDHENNDMFLEPCEMNSHHNRLAIQKLAKYEDLEEQCIKECECDLNMAVMKYKEFLENMHELAEYWKLEEQGLLLRLPCKVGDAVYLIKHAFCENRKIPMQCNIDEFTFVKGNRCYAVLNGDVSVYMMRRFKAVNIEEFGTTVFLTKEEAEQALKQMGE